MHRATNLTSRWSAFCRVLELEGIAFEPLLQPEATAQQLPGVGLYYSDALHGVPHVLSKAVRRSQS